MPEKSLFDKALLNLHGEECEDRHLNFIHDMVRKQIKTNIARHALNSLVMIIAMEREGKDSFSIVEDLKRFFGQMAIDNDEDPMRKTWIEDLLDENRKINEQKAKQHM